MAETSQRELRLAGDGSRDSSMAGISTYPCFRILAVVEKSAEVGLVSRKVDKNGGWQKKSSSLD